MNKNDRYLVFGLLTGFVILGSAFVASMFARPERVLTVLDIVCRIPLIMIVLLLILLSIKTLVMYLNRYLHVKNIAGYTDLIERIGLFSGGVALGTSFCFLIKIVKQLAGS